MHKEATTGFEPVIKVLQTSALPLGYVARRRVAGAPAIPASLFTVGLDVARLAAAVPGVGGVPVIPRSISGHQPCAPLPVRLLRIESKDVNCTSRQFHIKIIAHRGPDRPMREGEERTGSRGGTTDNVGSVTGKVKRGQFASSPEISAIKAINRLGKKRSARVTGAGTNCRHTE